MEVALLILAVWGFFPILAQEKIPVDRSFDIKKFNGKWYPIITANFYRPDLVKYFFAFTSRASPNSLEFITEIPIDGKCNLRKREMKVSGVGTFENKESDINSYIVETDNDNHVIFYDQNASEILLQLLAKKKEAPQQWENKFFSHARSLGFRIEKLSYLQKDGLCTDKMPHV